MAPMRKSIIQESVVFIKEGGREVVEELHNAIGIQLNQVLASLVEEGEGKGRAEEVATGQQQVPHHQPKGEGQVVGEDGGEPAVHEDIQRDPVPHQVRRQVWVGPLQRRSDIVHCCIHSSWCQGPYESVSKRAIIIIKHKSQQTNKPTNQPLVLSNSWARIQKASSSRSQPMTIKTMPATYAECWA